MQRALRAPSEPAGLAKRPQTKAWVAAWPRSGSSTIFEMILQGGRYENLQGQTSHRRLNGQGAFAVTPPSVAGAVHFGLFEPCHPKDRMDPELQGNCGKVMEKLLGCDFSGIHFLNHWEEYADISEPNASATFYSKKLAAERCGAAALLVYKTVDAFGRNINNMVPMLEADTSLHIVVPVRDPRGTFASFKQRPWGGEGIHVLQEMCDSAQRNIQQRHPRLMRVVFESLVADPEHVMQDVFGFLGLPFGVAQRQWSQRTFNAPCAQLGLKTGDYSACHTNSAETATSWQKTLTDEELMFFREHAPCREVAEAYDFPL